MTVLQLLIHIVFWYGLPLIALGLIVLLIKDGATFVAKRVSTSHPPHWPMTIAGMTVGTAIALGVGSIPLLDRDGPSLDSDWLRGLGLIAILMIPVFLAFFGLRRPGALLAAGVVSLPMPLMSFSFFLFPMLIPAVLYLVAHGRAPVTYKPRLPAPVVACLAFVLLISAFFSLFIREDPRCYEIVQRRDGSTVERPLPLGETGGSMTFGGSRVVGSGCSSDSVTPLEAGLSISLVALAVISTVYLSGPRRSYQASIDVYA